MVDNGGTVILSTSDFNSGSHFWICKRRIKEFPKSFPYWIKIPMISWAKILEKNCLRKENLETFWAIAIIQQRGPPSKSKLLKIIVQSYYTIMEFIFYFFCKFNRSDRGNYNDWVKFSLMVEQGGTVLLSSMDFKDGPCSWIGDELRESLSYLSSLPEFLPNEGSNLWASRFSKCRTNRFFESIAVNPAVWPNFEI